MSRSLLDLRKAVKLCGSVRSGIRSRASDRKCSREVVKRAYAGGEVAASAVEERRFGEQILMCVKDGRIGAGAD